MSAAAVPYNYVLIGRERNKRAAGRVSHKLSAGDLLHLRRVLSSVPSVGSTHAPWGSSSGGLSLSRGSRRGWVSASLRARPDLRSRSDLRWAGGFLNEECDL